MFPGNRRSNSSWDRSPATLEPSSGFAFPLDPLQFFPGRASIFSRDRSPATLEFFPEYFPGKSAFQFFPFFPQLGKNSRAEFCPPRNIPSSVPVQTGLAQFRLAQFGAPRNIPSPVPVQNWTGPVRDPKKNPQFSSGSDCTSTCMDGWRQTLH